MGKAPGTGNPPFEITAVRWPAGDPAEIEVDIERHLPLETEIDEIYVTYVMRDARNHPGYYGDVHFRRSQDPSAPALSEKNFTVRPTVRKL